MAFCGRASVLQAGTFRIRDDSGANALVFVLTDEPPSSCTGLIALSLDEYLKLQEVIAPTLSLDYVQLAVVWAFFCTFTVSLYLFSSGCNQVLNAVKKS